MRLEELTIQYECGGVDTLLAWEHTSPLKPFSDEITDFLATLSHCLKNDSESSQYPDVAALAFWCRKAALELMKKDYPDMNKRLGRGVVLHIAPSSIPLQFAYSLFAGLLAGNANLVRLSSKIFPQAQLVIKHINALLEHGFSLLKPYIVVCTYDYSKQPEINGYLSDLADARLIWGGDETITSLETYPIKPGGINLGFANRFSLCLIDTAAFIQEANQKRVAERFVTDAFTFNQQACSSPSLVVWLGTERIEEAQTAFWNHVQTRSNQISSVVGAQVLEKFDQQLLLATAIRSERIPTTDNSIFRIKLHDLPADPQRYACGHGFFLEYTCNDLHDVLPLFNNKKVQTVSYFGINKETVIRFVTENHCRGVDRVVPLGSSLSFSLVWDGTNLMEVLSRKIGQ